MCKHDRASIEKIENKYIDKHEHSKKAKERVTYLNKKMSKWKLFHLSHWDHSVGPSRVPVGNLGRHFVEFFRTLEDQSTRISPSTLLEGEEAPSSQTLTMWWGHKPRGAPRHVAT